MFKNVMRYDPDAKLLRLCRWGGNVNHPHYLATTNEWAERFHYSWQFSIGLRPSLFQWRREFGAWFLTLLGVRLHYRRDYGGMYAG